MTPLFPQADDGDTGNAEVSCPAQAAPRQLPRWPMDDCAAEDDDEAAQAILLQQVWAQEASGDSSAWGGGPADNKVAGEDKEAWEDKAVVQNETGDTVLTADCDGSQGEKDLLHLLAVTMKRHSKGAGSTELMNAQLIQDARNWAPHSSALARLPADLRGVKHLGMRTTHKLIKVLSVKQPELLPPVLMISLLDIARFWENHPELCKCIHDAAEDANSQLPNACAFTTEKEGDLAILAKGLQMWLHVQGREVFLIGVRHRMLSKGPDRTQFAGFHATPGMETANHWSL
ncbi:hypothetical protein BDK51DRAFT_28880 [Blyttiomyces helicus]|uniref:Uncharacterized protein n=1 Tax=Blyttiomyces helicus TaxID=388810 RepID=A0A4P9WM07_9FUNG|nr:hypothetical protein BDK51DRAFT_28880 [Blyttiomyces helicus]|eukprot:RKO93235.1 hypothetical protein BDK51DRAFT_28880 [Blyttiomyces helicus]